jgi:hypothetical protein
MIAAGILLRLALMPIGLHGDLLFIHYFPSFLSRQGIWDVYGHFGTHYLEQGFTYYGPALYFVIASGQWLAGFASGIFPKLMDRFHEQMWAGHTDPRALLAPFSYAQTLWVLFWMKLPYLAADAGILWLIGRMGAAAPVMRRARSQWLFHPVVLFSAYLFGQYRLLTALALWAVLWGIRRGWRGRACFVLGVLMLAETYPVLVAAPAILILGKSFTDRLRLAACFVLPGAAVLLPLAWHSDGLVWASYASPTMMRMATQSIFRSYPEAFVALGKAVLIVVWTSVVWLLAKRPFSADAAARGRLFEASAAAVLLALYAGTTTHVHYFMWILPVFVWIEAEGAPWPRALSAALVALLFIFNLDSPAVGPRLLAPLVPAWWDAPGIGDTFNTFVPWGKVVASSRLVFSVSCLWMASRLVDTRLRAGEGS